MAVACGIVAGADFNRAGELFALVGIGEVKAVIDVLYDNAAAFFEIFAERFE